MLRPVCQQACLFLFLIHAQTCLGTATPLLINEAVLHACKRILHAIIWGPMARHHAYTHIFVSVMPATHVLSALVRVKNPNAICII